MSNGALRIIALIAAGVIVVCALGFIVALAVTNHLDGTTTPIVISVLGIIATAIPALLTFALATQIHGLVNGNFSAAYKALQDIATGNPDRRSSDIASAAIEAAMKLTEPPLPPTPPEAT